MTAIGPRVQENQYDTQQFTLGLRGKVFDDWHYDGYVQYGESDQTKHQTGNVLRSKVFELTYAPDGGASICGGFDPFGLDSLTPACADYVAVDSTNHATVRDTIVEASINGPLAALPAGDLRAAFGLMYRDQSYRYRADENLRRTLPDGGPDVIGFDAADNMDASDHNLDAYVEAFVPLLHGRTGVESLDAVFGYRYSDYASAGGVSSWKAEVLYAPVQTARLRGSYQRAVRAPSIFELYQPRLASYGDFFNGEPCSVGSNARSGPDQAQVEALCVAQGMPASLLPTYYVDEISLVSGGNPELEPEHADTYTAGLVLQPRFESRLHRRPPGHDRLVPHRSRPFDPVRQYDRCGRQLLRPRVQSGLPSRQLLVFELRPRSDDWRDHRCRRYVQERRIAEHVGHRHAVAVVALQRVPVGSPSRGIIAWISSFQIQTAPGVAADELAGTIGNFGGSYPEWKWNFNIGYTIGGLTTGLRWRYIDSMKDGARSVAGLPDFNVTVPHYDYFDLEASYDVREGPLAGLVIRAGIQNLTDKDPPIFPSWSIANTDASQYDVLGRRFFIGVEYKL